MASVAFVALKPLKLAAKISAPLIQTNGKTLLLLHSGNISTDTRSNKFVKHINKLKDQNSNILLLNTSKSPAVISKPVNYDASLYRSKLNLFNSNQYKILYKGKIKTGIINTINPSGINPINELNSLAAFLKNEQKCDIVVCISHLGFRNKNNVDDYSLATGSAHIDVIVGGHPENFSKQPYIALNKNNSEVIISHSKGNEFDFKQIEIYFDDQKLKKNLVFSA